MAKIEQWSKRPLEEANLFNPAFLGSLAFEFIKTFNKHGGNGTPITFLAIALAVSLHKPSRQRLPYSTVTSLYEWLQENEDLLIGFDNRARGITPYLKEALSFSMSLETLDIANDHNFIIGSKKAHFPKSFLDETTSETKDIIERMRFMARWFAKSGSEVSIVASWGIRP